MSTRFPQHSSACQCLGCAMGWAEDRIKDLADVVEQAIAEDITVNCRVCNRDAQVRQDSSEAVYSICPECIRKKVAAWSESLRDPFNLA